MHIIDLFPLGAADIETFLVRLINAALILSCGVALFLASYLVNSVRVTKFLWRVSVFVTSFFVFRIGVEITSRSIGYDLDLLTDIINIVFWGYVSWKIWRLNYILSKGTDDTQRQTLRRDIDLVLDQMAAASASLREMKRTHR